MKVKFLQAFYGDSILISFTDEENQERNILIDGGPPKTYDFLDEKNGKANSKNLKSVLERIRKQGEKIDLLILTHIDDDHIGGILKWFSSDKLAPNLIGNVWFNSAQSIAESLNTVVSEEDFLEIEPSDGLFTGVRQGIKFEKYLEEHNLWDRTIIKFDGKYILWGAVFTILSPNEIKLDALKNHWMKESGELFTGGADDYDLSLREHIENDAFIEDPSVPNGSSIAFIFELNEKKVLFLGDAHSKVIVQSLVNLGYSKEKPFKVDLVKLSHHGSHYNTSYELLELIDCQAFVICSNGAKHSLPDKQCLARIINSKKDPVLYFNYEEQIDEIFSPQDFIDFQFKAETIDEFTI